MGVVGDRLTTSVLVGERAPASSRVPVVAAATGRQAALDTATTIVPPQYRASCAGRTRPVTVQPAVFDIPPVIRAGLSSGALVRYGGVVRNSQGHIVKHLKELPITSGAPEAAAKRLVASIKDHKGIVFLSLAAVGAAVGGGISSSTKKRKGTQASIERYDASLQAYLEALRSGTLDAAMVSRLINDLDVVRALAEKAAITVDFSTEPSATLVNLVVDYTMRLAEANNADLDELKTLEPGDGGDTVVYLRRHLEAQRKIFTETA